MVRIGKLLFAGIFSIILAAGALPLRAEESASAGSFAITTDTTKPVILVAKRALVDPFWGRTVLFATPLPKNKDVHIGFIANRPSLVTMGRLFPEHEPSKKIAETVRFGGPEMAEAIFMVVRSDERPSKGAFQLDDGLFVISNGKEVDAFIERAGEKELGAARFFAGFVGWQPGELQKEIKKGAWHVLDAPASEFFFGAEPERLWEDLINRVEMKTKGI